MVDNSRMVSTAMVRMMATRGENLSKSVPSGGGLRRISEGRGAPWVAKEGRGGLQSGGRVGLEETRKTSPIHSVLSE